MSILSIFHVVLQTLDLRSVSSPQAEKLVWEQEIYNQLMYQRAKPFFHTFPGDVSIFVFSLYFVHVKKH